MHLTVNAYQYVQMQLLHSIISIKQQNLVFKTVQIIILKMICLVNVFYLEDVVLAIMQTILKENVF
jgi:hypothetical protein